MRLFMYLYYILIYNISKAILLNKNLILKNKLSTFFAFTNKKVVAFFATTFIYAMKFLYIAVSVFL